MILRNLGSGSGGNATVVAQDGRAILIDAGLDRARILAGLGDLRLEGILITHRHSDHLGRDAQVLGAPVWIEKANWKDALRLRWIRDEVHFFGEPTFNVGPFEITAFPLPHPGRSPWNSYGFLVECGTKRLAYATDLGRVTNETLAFLRDCDVVFLESNHDVVMEERSGRAPGHINWVLSETGHLSNRQCADALSQVGSPHTVVLGHISKECNTPDLALACARQVLPRTTRLLAAEQSAASAEIAV
jgi:phosphoribosyl 1,2-cyclic phosphodiesterase